MNIGMFNSSSEYYLVGVFTAINVIKQTYTENPVVNSNITNLETNIKNHLNSYSNSLTTSQINSINNYVNNIPNLNIYSELDTFCKDSKQLLSLTPPTNTLYTHYDSETAGSSVIEQYHSVPAPVIEYKIIHNQIVQKSPKAKKEPKPKVPKTPKAKTPKPPKSTKTDNKNKK
jgi:hypothetical protein